MLSYQTQLQLYPLDQDGRAGLVPYASARGCVQTLSLEDSGHPLPRTVAGEVMVPSLLDAKYVSTITCTDTYAVGVDHLGRGMKVWVECLAVLSSPFLPEGTESWTTPRNAVLRSVHFHCSQGRRRIRIPCTFIQGRRITLPPSCRGGGFILYRPRLAMVITAFQVTKDESKGSTTWDMRLQEL